MSKQNTCKCGVRCWNKQCRQCYLAWCESTPSRSRVYGIWGGMIRRCTAPQDKDYHRYGARGITVCKAWMKFRPFERWAMSHGFVVGLSLERKKNDRGYMPSNCKWATAKEQARNRRGNTLITAFSETKTISQWAEDPRCNVNNATLIARLTRQKMDVVLAITHPPLDRGRKRLYRVFDGHS